MVAKDLFTWCLKHVDDKDAGRRELYSCVDVITGRPGVQFILAERPPRLIVNHRTRILRVR